MAAPPPEIVSTETPVNSTSVRIEESNVPATSVDLGNGDASARQDSTSIARNEHARIITVQDSMSIVPDAPSGDNQLGSTYIAQMSPDREGDMSNDLPRRINLETSGLRRSARLRNESQSDNSGPAIMAYTSSFRNERPFKTSMKKQRMSFYSVFSAVGTLWCFASLSMPHFFDNKCHSFVTRFSNDYEKINGLFDDTINDVVHHVKAFTTSNESYTYSKMLKEDDYRDFFQAMLDEIEVHEKREHWTLMERKDMPTGTRTIMAIWSFKRKRYPSGLLNKHKARLCAHGGQQTWGQDYWDTYAPVVHHVH